MWKMGTVLCVVVTALIGGFGCSCGDVAKIARKAAAAQQADARSQEESAAGEVGSTGNSALAKAVNNHAHEKWVAGTGKVSKILKDDNKGSKHQRFIVQWAPGKTVLMAHNIDLAPRVPVAVGDTVEFRGKYVWNANGGIVHYTHRKNGAAAGWIKHKGEVFQ